MSDSPPGWGPPPPPPGWAPPPPGWTPPPPPAGWGASPSGWGPLFPSGPAFVPLGGLATALMVLLVMDAVVAVLAAAAFAYRASVIGRFLTDDASVGDLEDGDGLVAAAMLLLALVTIATVVLWIIWQHRHAHNAVGLAGPLPLGPGWAIGGWFIPLANYVLGPLQLYHSAAASDPRRGVGAGGGTRPGRVPGVLIAWWITFVASTAVTFVGQVMRPSNDGSLGLGDYLRDVQAADRLAAVGVFVNAAAAVLATLTVRVLSERQDAAIERRLTPGLTPGVTPGLTPPS